LERVTGIEPALSAWEADVLPLNYTRTSRSGYLGVPLAAVSWQLAQLNIGRLQAPLDAPESTGFVAALEPVNALADAAPGFVWRLQTEDGDATAIRAFPDDLVIVNMSVWASLEALADFVYQSDHRQIMARRREWFERLAEAYLVLWWVPEGHRPTVDEAKQRLARLRAEGPGPEAFTFRQPHPPPGVDASAGGADERWACPAG
jgi:Domain of unknown function (DUF3291)